MISTERRASGVIARRHTERGYDQLSREVVRVICRDLYQLGHNTLMGIDAVAGAYAERTWNGQSSSDEWIAITVEGRDNDFNVYQHPTWGVFSVDKFTKMPGGPKAGHAVLTEEVEVCTGSNNAPANFRAPYFNHAGLANSPAVEVAIEGFMADMARQVQPAA